MTDSNDKLDDLKDKAEDRANGDQAQDLEEKGKDKAEDIGEGLKDKF